VAFLGEWLPAIWVWAVSVTLFIVVVSAPIWVFEEAPIDWDS